ncbi:retrotransposon protein, putative, ty1-copia subclass [Tanacetum coccineum]
MQEKLKFSKSQGASTPAKIQRIQNIPYASAVGSIMYAMRCTRPDVTFAHNITSRFQQNPGDAHWTAVKNILKYLRNTKDMFLVYGGTVDWKSTKKSIFATSSINAEYIVAFDASKEAVWIRKFISGLGVVPTIEEPINMYCDNTEAITIAKDHGITKGVVNYQYIPATPTPKWELLEYGSRFRNHLQPSTRKKEHDQKVVAPQKNKETKKSGRGNEKNNGWHEAVLKHKGSGGGGNKSYDLFSGKWVENPDGPYYPNETCWAIQEHQNCMKFGRKIFDPILFLKMMRGKSLAFVGDSVARNHMQSLLCLLSRVVYTAQKATSATAPLASATEERGGRLFRAVNSLKNFKEMYNTQLQEYKIEEREGRKKGIKFSFMDMTQIMQMRPDGHPSKYGHWPQQNVTMANDCVHWCLPGPIDAWNDFLMELISREDGSR